MLKAGSLTILGLHAVANGFHILSSNNLNEPVVSIEGFDSNTAMDAFSSSILSEIFANKSVHILAPRTLDLSLTCQRDHSQLHEELELSHARKRFIEIDWCRSTKSDDSQFSYEVVCFMYK